MRAAPAQHPFSTRRGKAFRDSILARDLFTCQMCGVLTRQGKRDARSAVVDHLLPIALAPELTFDPDNCRCVCARCHNGPCASIEKRAGDDVERIRAEKLSYRPVGLDGYPVSRPQLAPMWT